LPLYAARIEDLRLGDFVKVDCVACHHVALLTPEAEERECDARGWDALPLMAKFLCRLFPKQWGGKGSRALDRQKPPDAYRDVIRVWGVIVAHLATKLR
jgi:hypothetical protein